MFLGRGFCVGGFAYAVYDHELIADQQAAEPLPLPVGPGRDELELPVRLIAE